MCSINGFAERQKVILAVDIDDTLGAFLPFDNLDKASKLEEEGHTIIHHEFIVDSMKNPEEFLVCEKIAKKAKNKKYKIEPLDDSRFKVSEWFMLRQAMIDRIIELDNHLSRKYEVELHITSISLGPRAHSLIKYIPSSIRNMTFSRAFNIVPRIQFSKNFEKGEKTIRGKSTRNMANESWFDSSAIVVAIDDLDPSLYELREQDHLWHVKKFSPDGLDLDKDSARLNDEMSQLIRKLMD